MAKSNAGAPTKFKEEFQEKCRKLAKYGLIDKEMADVCGVTLRTFNNWKTYYPEFFHSLKTGKKEADKRVKESLYKRAIGFTINETKVFCHEGQIIKEEIEKYIPPDITAAQVWLYNRCGDEFKRNPIGITKDDQPLEIVFQVQPKEEHAKAKEDS